MGKILLTFLGLFLAISAAPSRASDAWETDREGAGYLDAERETLDGEAEEEGTNSHGPRKWVCYSRYVGLYGWGTYYGWAFNYPTAYRNALGLCQLDHRLDPLNCVVTGCHVR